MSQSDSPRFDRRAIPADAQEVIWRAADSHAIRRIDWPAPPASVPVRGHILFMPGRGDTYEKYLETFEHWRCCGWHVSAADWRGQAGSGRLGTDNRTGHIEDFSIWLNDLAGLWRDWSAGRDGPLVLAGHSMGGHLTLRAIADDVLRPLPAALILCAPMLDVVPEHLPMFAKQAYSAGMARLGNPARPAWKASEKPGSGSRVRQLLLTHDDDRYGDELWWHTARPELAMGPASWGWLRAAMASVAHLFRRGRLELVEVPVFILATTADKLVSPAAIRRALDRLPNAEGLFFGAEARHEILREADPVRNRALIAIDEFMARKVDRDTQV